MRGTICASRRASAAPTQKCTPLPKVACTFAAVSVEAELGWRFEVCRIAIGGAPHEQQMGIGRRFDTGKRDIAPHVSVMPAKRWLEAHTLRQPQ
jgi:hypothetical protein